MVVEEQKPKYAEHIFKGKIELPIDSISFLTNSNEYHICDRSRGEDPRVVISFIYYPKENKLQLRIAGKAGDKRPFRIEPPNYYKKHPSEWIEKIWITIPMDKVDLLTKFLENANPTKLSSFM
jgi:hypothetical protein